LKEGRKEFTPQAGDYIYRIYRNLFPALILRKSKNNDGFPDLILRK